MSEPRVLIISHGHPDFSVGGGEIAAYANWMELRRRGVETMFLARMNESPGRPSAPFHPRSQDGLECLVNVPPTLRFRHSQPAGGLIHCHFREQLERFRPTAVHFHHYVHLGVEFIREARKFDPELPIIITLHEYLAICHAQGQMLKTSGMLCKKASPIDCHVCFPDISPQDFFLRELFIKSFFDLVDYFVCPSRFLRDRYVDWGLPAEKFIVIENGQPRSSEASHPAPSATGRERRFVVLGQLSRLKGTLVMLDAIRLLPKAVRKQIQVEIHGWIGVDEVGFKEKLLSAVSDLEGTVRMYGPYLPEHVGGIIRRNGWVIVPSIWWENSPLVIQEAFAAGRPVICSNVGGMAEKVQDGVNGLHFRVNSAGELADRIEECARGPELWQKLCAGLPQPPSIADTVDELLALYINKRPASA